MPRIPTLQSRPVEATVEFAQVPTGAVRLNTGSVQQSLGNVGEAISRTPKVQAEDFSGLIALGKGVADVGRFTAEIAQREQQLTNAHTALKFQNATAEANAEINGLMDTEVDPDEMQRKVEEVIARTQKGADFDNTDDHQKGLLNSGMERFVTNARNSAKYGAIKIRQRNFRNDSSATERTAIATENTEALAGVIQARLAAGETTPEQAKASITLGGIQIRANITQRVSKDIEADIQVGDFTAARVKWAQTWGHVGDTHTPEEQYAKRSIEAQITKAEVVQTFTRAIEEDPDKYDMELSAVDAKGEPKNYPEMTWIERQNYIAHTKKVQLRNSVQATDRAMNDIATGNIKTFDQIKATKGLQPRDWATLARMLPGAPAPDEKVWGSISRSILGMQVSDDPEVRANQQLRALQWTQMWPEDSPQRKILNGLVADRFKDPSADASIDDAAKTYLREQLSVGNLDGEKVGYDPGEEGWFGTDIGKRDATPLLPDDEAKIAAKAKDRRKGTLVKTPAGYAAKLQNQIDGEREIQRLKKLPSATSESVEKGIKAWVASRGVVDVLRPQPAQSAPDAALLPPLTEAQRAEAQAILNR